MRAASRLVAPMSSMMTGPCPRPGGPTTTALLRARARTRHECRWRAGVDVHADAAARTDRRRARTRDLPQAFAVSTPSSCQKVSHSTNQNAGLATTSDHQPTETPSTRRCPDPMISHSGIPPVLTIYWIRPSSGAVTSRRTGRATGAPTRAPSYGPTSLLTEETLTLVLRSGTCTESCSR